MNGDEWDSVYSEVKRLILDRLDCGDVECDLSTNLIEVSLELKTVLQELLPEVRVERIAAVRKVKDIASLFTVAT